MAGIAGGYRCWPEAFPEQTAALFADALVAREGQSATTLPLGGAALVALPLPAGSRRRCVGRSRWWARAERVLRRALRLPRRSRLGWLDTGSRGSGLFDRGKVRALLEEQAASRLEIARRLAAALAIELLARESSADRGRPAPHGGSQVAATLGRSIASPGDPRAARRVHGVS